LYKQIFFNCIAITDIQYVMLLTYHFLYDVDTLK